MSTSNAIYELLTADPGRSWTAPEIAKEIGAGRSTVAKKLAAMLGDDAFPRLSKHVGGHITDPTVWCVEPEVSEPEPNTEPSLDGDAPEDGHRKNRDGQPKLRRGGLGALVADYLAAHPDNDFAPAKVAKDIGGRSNGAVHNALEKMVRTGRAVRTSDKPKRYQVKAG